MIYEPSDQPLDAKQSAAEVGLSLPGFWKAVSKGRLPQPVYPLPRAPRWIPSELKQAILETRARPSVAKSARQAARIQQALPAGVTTRLVAGASNLTAEQRDRPANVTPQGEAMRKRRRARSIRNTNRLTEDPRPAI